MKQNNYLGALQKPIGSGFTAASTSTEVISGIDLTGKTAIVTGGSIGIGLETAMIMAIAGATVIVLARNLEKAKMNLAVIRDVEIEELDTMIPSSIDKFAEELISSGRPLHLLINNAGVMRVPLQRDLRGIESQLAKNYVGPFHLTAKL